LTVQGFSFIQFLLQVALFICTVLLGRYKISAKSGGLFTPCRHFFCGADMDCFALFLFFVVYAVRQLSALFGQAKHSLQTHKPIHTNTLTLTPAL
jgi:hypothetical protein